MIAEIPDVLDAAQLAEVRAGLEQVKFVDGKITAGWRARLVKNNEQVDATQAEAKRLARIIEQALLRNTTFNSYSRPRKITPVMFNRYGEGMEYGAHIDNALMHGIRTDVSFTVFLTEPEDYDGGALVIETDVGERAYRLKAGSCIVYPSTALHRVDMVTRGARLAGVGWVRSLIRSPDQRQIVHDLETVRKQMYQKQGRTPELDLLSKSLTNLQREWIED
jgi:PKHD-type hydroxylase